MKIENNGINPLSPKKAEESRAVEQSRQQMEPKQVERSQDKAEISENARLLAKARVALSELSEVETAKLEALQKSVQDGTYTVPVKDLAERLAGFFRP